MEGEISSAGIWAVVGPFPDAGVLAKVGASVMAFRLPLVRDAAPDDFALRLGIKDIDVADGVWDLFDAGRVFPRNAASLDLDVAGKAWFDLLGLAEDDPAGRRRDPARWREIVSLALRSLAVAVAGATLSGEGAFTFATGADGVPVPDGRAGFAMTRANALLDRAVSAGIATVADVRGTRMMMGMFMRPGTGGDSLTSEIEAKVDGSVTLNAMPLRSQALGHVRPGPAPLPVRSGRRASGR